MIRPETINDIHLAHIWNMGIMVGNIPTFVASPVWAIVLFWNMYKFNNNNQCDQDNSFGELQVNKELRGVLERSHCVWFKIKKRGYKTKQHYGPDWGCHQTHPPYLFCGIPNHGLVYCITPWIFVTCSWWGGKRQLSNGIIKINNN